MAYHCRCIYITFFVIMILVSSTTSTPTGAPTAPPAAPPVMPATPPTAPTAPEGAATLGPPPSADPPTILLGAGAPTPSSSPKAPSAPTAPTAPTAPHAPTAPAAPAAPGAPSAAPSAPTGSLLFTSLFRIQLSGASVATFTSQNETDVISGVASPLGVPASNVWITGRKDVTIASNKKTKFTATATGLELAMAAKSASFGYNSAVNTLQGFLTVNKNQISGFPVATVKADIGASPAAPPTAPPPAVVLGGPASVLPPSAPTVPSPSSAALVVANNTVYSTARVEIILKSFSITSFTSTDKASFKQAVANALGIPVAQVDVSNAGATTISHKLRTQSISIPEPALKLTLNIIESTADRASTVVSRLQSASSSNGNKLGAYNIYSIKTAPSNGAGTLRVRLWAIAVACFVGLVLMW